MAQGQIFAISIYFHCHPYNTFELQYGSLQYQFHVAWSEKIVTCVTCMIDNQGGRKTRVKGSKKWHGGG